MENEALIWSKIKAYCDKAERCHWDVQNKLNRMSVPFREHGFWIAKLIEGNFLNEERFARAYAHDHHAFKKWGLQKIKQGLKQKRISDSLIQVVLKDIPAEDEWEMLLACAKKKWNNLTESNHLKKKMKLTRYLFNKGFNATAIQKVVHQLSPGEPFEFE